MGRHLTMLYGVVLIRPGVKRADRATNASTVILVAADRIAGNLTLRGDAPP